MKKVVPCVECCRRAEGYEVGFAGRPVLYCTERAQEAGADDGCTFGEEGEGMRLCKPYEVTVDDAVVYGRWE